MPVIQLFPIATCIAVSWTTNGTAPTDHEAVDDPVATPDDDTTYTETLGTDVLSLRFDAMPAATRVNSVAVKWRARHIAGPTVRLAASLWLGQTVLCDAGATAYGSGVSENLTASFVDYSHTWTLNPRTGKVFTRDEVNFIAGGVSVPIADSRPRVTQLYLEVDYQTEPTQVEASRSVASRNLRMFRRAPEFLRLGSVSPLMADLGLLDPIAMSHFLAVTPDGEGWGRTVWERGLGHVFEQEIDPERVTVALKAVNSRELLLRFWSTDISDLTASTVLPGVARFDIGASSLHSRTTRAWVEDPADARIRQMAIDQESITSSGLLLEEARSNLLIESGLKNGATDVFTGWTKAGDSGGRQIVEDTSVLYFDSEIVPRTAKLDYVATGADLTLTGTATASQAANTLVTVSLGHIDPTGGAMFLDLQRAFDSRYWNEAGGTWDVAQPYNPVPVSQDEWARYEVAAAVDVGGSATTLTPIVGVEDGVGVAGQENHVGHVQIEVGRFMTSVIQTETAAFTRAVASVTTSNDHGKRVWPDQGTGFLRFQSRMDAADLAAGTVLTLIDVEYDTSNLYRVFYDKDTAAIVFRARLAAANSDATKAITLTRGTVYSIGWRWTSDQGELDLTNYTVSAFVDGVKGTDATPGGRPQSIPSEMVLRWGHDQSTPVNVCNGYISHRLITPFVLLDEEVAALP
jgi:hypothetical protein